MRDAPPSGMATPTEPVVPVIEPPYLGGPLVTAERSAIVSPLGWSAILAGAAVSIGVWLILHTLGIGIGLIAIDPDDASTLRGVGIGAGVWSVIAPLIALFIGGLVAGRVAPTINTANAAIHGAVVWSISTIAAILLLVMTVGTVVRGAAATGAAVDQVAGRTVAATVGALPQGSSLADLGISADDLVGPINERLQAAGKPPVTAQQLENAARDALRTSVREGRLDREQLIQAITRNTALTRTDVEQLADRAERRLTELRAQATELREQAKKAALEAAEVTGQVLLLLSSVMIVGLGLSIVGAIVSVRRERREHVVLPRARVG